MDNSEGIKQPNECLKDGSSNEHISIHFFIYQPNLTKSLISKTHEFLPNSWVIFIDHIYKDEDVYYQRQEYFVVAA